MMKFLRRLFGLDNEPEVLPPIEPRLPDPTMTVADYEREVERRHEASSLPNPKRFEDPLLTERPRKPRGRVE